MDRVREQFVAATRRAEAAGFDLLELHFAHGYLLSSFLSPLTNRRTDEYGGELADRARFPLEVLDACRAVWPAERPISVRISATDWVPGGFEGDDAVALAQLLREHDVDVVHVSTGQVSPDQAPAYGRSFQTPFADRIRNEVEIPTIAVGAISSSRTSTRRSSPAAPTSARSGARTSTTPTGRCTRRPSTPTAATRGSSSTTPGAASRRTAPSARPRRRRDVSTSTTTRTTRRACGSRCTVAEMAEDALVLTHVEDGVALSRMNRAGTRNVLSPELRDALAGALEQADADPAVRCHVVAGGDETFAAGADIATMRAQTFQEALRAPAARFWPRLRAIRKPVVAAVSGYALGGGCELALACDLVVASETAVFSQPEVGLGILPGGGGTQRLARLLGRQRAMELVLTGRGLTAHEAQQLGIVNRIAPEDGWLDAATELAGTIAHRSGLAVELAKRAVLAAEETSLTAGLAQERDLFVLAMAGEDRVEGMTAFLEKRKPFFRGR